MAKLQGYLRDKNNNQLFLDNNYSTNETVIGTWINGKPLYRRIFTGTISNDWTIIDIASLNIDKLFVDYSHTYFIKANGGTETIWYFDNNDMGRILRNGDKIELYIASFSNAQYLLVIEYTKTTD